MPAVAELQAWRWTYDWETSRSAGRAAQGCSMALGKSEEQGMNDVGGSRARQMYTDAVAQQKITTIKGLADHRLSFLATGLGMPTAQYPLECTHDEPEPNQLHVTNVRWASAGYGNMVHIAECQRV